MTSVEVPQRTRKRSRVRRQMAEVYAPNLTDTQVDAVIDYVWARSREPQREQHYDQLMDAHILSQASWWGTQSTRSG